MKNMVYNETPTTKVSTMNETFTKLAQANLDHYNNHPTTHLLGVAVYGVVAMSAIGWMARRAHRDMLESRIANNARL